MRAVSAFFGGFTLLILSFGAGFAAETVTKITPDIAYERALAGEIILVDIRTPREWAETGVSDVALLADMSAKDFIDRVIAIRQQEPTLPIAFICRSGNRSGRVTQALAQAGLTGVIDVVEGMGGSALGKGYVARGLPLRPAAAPVNPVVTVNLP